MRRAAVVTLLALACRREVAPPRATTQRPDAPVAAAAQRPAPYRVEAVTQGGTITGIVRWEGPRPALEPFVVGPVGNPSVCGATQPAEALEIAADTGGVAHTVVSLSDITRGRAPDPGTVTVDQTACRYAPHVTAVATGTEVRFTNSDRGAIHNVHAYYGYDDDDNWFNQASPHGLTVTKRVQRAGVARLICDAGHVWMLAYVHAFTHPYFAVTDAAGRYELRAVPPGRYTLRFWHEGWTRRAMEGTRTRFSPAVETSRVVDVAPGGAVTADFSLRPDATAVAVQ